MEQRQRMQHFHVVKEATVTAIFYTIKPLLQHVKYCVMHDVL